MIKKLRSFCLLHFRSDICFLIVVTLLSAIWNPSLSLNAQGSSAAKSAERHANNEQQAVIKNLDASLLSNLKWRCIGPAVPSGRISCIAVVEKNPEIIYAGAATGGVWKTTNNGATWQPAFSREGTISIGAVAVSQSNPNIVWVGTGESWNARSSSYGDGVYKSEDGGKTWKNMGLEKTRYINWILIHPEDPDIVYMAALGSLWGPNEERGLFKTIDGGKTWLKVLYISKHTGVQDAAMDPTNPNVLYAASFQRERRAWNFIGGGPEGGIFKSYDGGVTWEKLTNGLPNGDMGRIGLSICRTKPNVIYASIQAKAEESGTYRSDDYGASWVCVNREIYTRSDFGKIRCDPNNADRLYLCHVRLYLSEDGGKTFRTDVFGSAHGDWRAFWIDPANSDHLVVGNDGGLCISYDRGRSWDFMQNLPIAQFYAVGVDMQEPFYYVYGGTQDNSTYGGPSRTRYSDGIRNSDWFLVTGGDGFYAQIDPTDPAVVYGESQYGVLYRFDKRTGELRAIQPQPPDREIYRWNWSTPILISHYDHNTLYFAANKVFCSPNQGDTWEVISPDLTRQLDAYNMPIMGKVWPRDAVAWHQATAELGTISSISESSLRSGLLAVGTDDGLIQVTRDNGKNWLKIEKFPGVPECTWVSRVFLSNHNEETIYATFDARKDNDFKPYVIKSIDLGKTWKSITGNLPEFGSVSVIIEHHRNPNLLFVGTETGVFLSITGGNYWVQLKNNLPTVMAWDMLIHPRENDLVLATHGNSFWILDDITILEELTPEVIKVDSHLCSIKPAIQFHRFDRGGHSDFSTPNPPDGAIITYSINPEMTKSPKVKIEILDAEGKLIQSLNPRQGEKGTGIQRLVWDLRHSLPFKTDADEISPFRRAQKGPFVLPGEYKVRLVVNNSEHVSKVVVKGDPLISISPEDRRIWHDALMTLTQMEGIVRAALSTINEIEKQLAYILDVLKWHQNGPQSLTQKAQSILAEAQQILIAICGKREQVISAQQEALIPLSDMIRRLYSSIEGSTGRPTDDQSRQIQNCLKLLNDQVEKVNGLATKSLPALNNQLNESGVSWTPGRPIKPVETNR
jgi:photosystem II stability/assembly factor-like uncharacterized protein